MTDYTIRNKRININLFPIIQVVGVFLLGFLISISAAYPGYSKVEGDQFSFVVFGDSRIPAYAPYDKNHREELDKLVHAVTRFVYAGSEPPYEADFDPDTLKLKKLVFPGEKKGQSRVITYGKDGWPDVFVDRAGDSGRVSFLAEGQEWVYDNVVREVKTGVNEDENGPGFVLHTGDMVYFGFQGKGADESPYWRDLDRRVLSRLPEGGPGDLTARYFPVLGNHETWGDKKIVGFRETFPYLKKHGFSIDHRVYHFDYKNSRFIFLDSGIMNPKKPAEWYKSTPGYEKQMEYLKTWLDNAVAKNMDHAFLTLHYPVFCSSGYGPLPPEHNPHSLLKSYAEKIDINVFTGHVHTTEAYKVDGIRYFVAGGGGGEQGFTTNDTPEDYPKEHYWQGRPRKLDYNYLVVKVSGEEVEVTVKRFRPNELKPFSEVKLVPDRME